MNIKEISVNVLRLNNEFCVNCSQNQDFFKFKDQCKRLCKYPIDKFIFIVAGNEIDERDTKSWNIIFNSNKIYIFVQSFYKNDEPNEFYRERRMNKELKKKKENFMNELPMIMIAGVRKFRGFLRL